MKIRSAAALVLIAACAAPPAVDLDDARASLREAATAYHDAAASGDADAVVALYAEDGMMMGPGEADAAGLDAVRAQAEGFTSLPDFTFRANEPELLGLSQDGTMGYTVATIDLSWTADGEAVSERLRDVHIWTRAADGSWQLLIDVWNAAAPSGME